LKYTATRTYCWREDWSPSTSKPTATADGDSKADECLKTISVFATHWHLTFLCAEFVKRAHIETPSGRWIAFSAALALTQTNRSDALTKRDVARLEKALRLEDPSSNGYPTFRETLAALKEQAAAASAHK
jgi:hypothetical protein